MNGNTGRSRGRSSLRRLAAATAAAAALALLAAACGGGGSSSGGNSTTYQKELAFSECMRAHGVPSFPDPGSNGVFSIQGSGAAKGTASKDQRIGGAQMSRANNACRHLLPNDGVATAAQRQQMLNQALRFTECMRSHGVPNMPDPGSGGGGISLGGSGVNMNSPQFQTAQRACQKYLIGKGHGSGLRVAS
jgi:hypothetical protein